MSIFSLVFWKTALEHAIVAGSAGALAVLPITGQITTLASLKGAAIGFAGGFIYALIKQVGAVQLANSVLKVGGKHAAPPPTL